MRLINEAFVDRLPAATPDMKPLCFPGKYPTRLWIRLDDQVYLGKPVAERVMQLYNMIMSEKMSEKSKVVEFIEFDRHAKFFGCANHRALGTREYFAWYHPSVPMSVFELRSWLGRPFHTLRVKEHAFYSTYPVTDDKELIEKVSQRLDPQAKSAVVAPLKLTRPKPRKEDFSTYAQYVQEYTKWKHENAGYLALREKEKKAHMFSYYDKLKPVPW